MPRQELQDRGFLAAPSPASIGVRGLQGPLSPPASFFQFPWGHQMLLPRCHLEEMRISKAEWRAGESREEGRKQ